MRIVKGAVNVAISLAIIAAVTTFLWYVKAAGVGPRHPVFFYLLPIVIVACLYGSMPALLSAVTAMMCAAFFLCDPVFSFHIADTRELGDLVCFAILALISVKTMVELLRPGAKMPAPRSRYGRP
jgi:K+-sensing histidine kinase KdpD